MGQRVNLVPSSNLIVGSAGACEPTSLQRSVDPKIRIETAQLLTSNWCWDSQTTD